MSRLAAVCALALLSACAAHRPPAPRELVLDPLIVEAGGAEALALAGLNASELFQTGTAAFAAKDFEKAARAFTRVVELYPEDSRATQARFNAGLSWERMGEYRTALAHYEVLLEASEGEAWREAAFRAAECLYHLEDFRAAANLLHAVAEAEGARPNERIEALVQEGVCLLEAGADDEAEDRLRKAVGRYHLEVREGSEKVDDYFAAQGQFFLGELFRLRYERAPFDTSGSDLEKLREDLEHKAQLLLSAQGHYLRAIRLRHPKWATAAGYRIGRLYEVLYDQFTAAQAPRALGDAAERLAYRTLLREEIRILLSKAMDAYERTLATAERIGLEGEWKSRVEASFERVRRVLLEDLAPDA